MAGMNGPPPIEVVQLRKVFRQSTSGQLVVAIEKLDLHIASREVVAIVGQTGCGKSTFFDLMIGLEAPTQGSIEIGGLSRFRRPSLFSLGSTTAFYSEPLVPGSCGPEQLPTQAALVGGSPYGVA